MGQKIVSDIVKVYPHMLKIVIYHQNITVPVGARAPKRKSSSRCSPDRSIRRTRSLISDIIACNRFDLWCTFTFNCRKCGTGCKNWIKGNRCVCPKGQCLRFDPDACKFRMSSWLHRQKVKNPGFSYLIVPEFHKNGALHFHAFVKNCSSKLVFTGKVDKGHKVFSFLNYTLGWSEVVDISSGNGGDFNKIAVYMQKYITKDMPQFRNRKRYFVSQGLERPSSHTNGVAKFNLSRIVRGYHPEVINDLYEVQVHPIVDFDKSRDKNVRLSLYDRAYVSKSSSSSEIFVS